jgi:hypothetical protein
MTFEFEAPRAMTFEELRAAERAGKAYAAAYAVLTRQSRERDPR